MSESVIADFVGKFNAEGLARAEPVPGRILLSRRQLVLAAKEDEKVTIPVSSIVDIAVGHVPPGLGEFFDATVTLGFERDGKGHVAVIEGEDDHIEKFSNVLFKAILNGTDATIKKRARIGGRVTDEPFTATVASIEPSAVAFAGSDAPFEIGLETVVDFYKTDREIAGKRQSVLAIRHLKGDTAVTTLVAVPSQRTMSILARYLRLEYGEHVRTVQKQDLSAVGQQLLVALYSAGPRDVARLADVVDADVAEVRPLVEELNESGLVDVVGDEGDGRPVLTRTGTVAASQYARMMEE